MFLRLQWSFNVISNTLNRDLLLKKNTLKSLQVRKHACPNVAILLLLVCFGLVLINYSGQQVNFKVFSLSPIIKSMVSHCNTKTCSPAEFIKINFISWIFYQLMIIYAVFAILSAPPTSTLQYLVRNTALLYFTHCIQLNQSAAHLCCANQYTVLHPCTEDLQKERNLGVIR